MPEPWDAERLEWLGRLVEAWALRQLEENPSVAHVERIDDRWFVRVNGEEKDVFTVWFTLGQRTLHYETYLMPYPEENEAQLFEHLLRRNRGLYGAQLCIGEEDAVFLSGQIANGMVDEDELDRILGSLYEWTERFFRPAMRIGFASRFPR